MSRNSESELQKSEPFVGDPITAIFLQAARKLLGQALEAEAEFFLS
jgi:hypothetical protein